MRCPTCQAENPDANRFCEQCGAALERRCPQCGEPLRPGARFCGACGHRLGESLGSAPFPSVGSSLSPAAGSAPAPAVGPAPPSASVAAPASGRERRLASYTPKHLAEKILTGRSALEGERRQVTVLFADLAGFTTLAETLDPEDVHRIIDRCFDLITTEVHRFEGTINQYTGDGVMALFGAPIAHEDSARRAVHAALGIQRALRDYGSDLQAQRGLTLQMRIGLNTGPVVVGRIGDDLRMDYTAVGDTTNLAARMQQNARPGSVFVSEATHKLISGFFETLELGAVQVKGHTAVQAFEVLRPRGRRSRFDVAAERGLTPFVGRSRELATLLDRFAEVKAGGGQVVFVAGEAGIGKSRLLLEFRLALAEAREDVTWLEGQCVSFGKSIPFLPLIDQLRRNFMIEEFDGEPEIIAKVEHGMRRMGDLEAHIPYVRYLLSADAGDPTVSAMEAVARRKKVFDAVRALALRGTRFRPIVFVFEDLHWIDTSTEEYLGTLMDSVAGVPIMLVMTHRIGYAQPFGSRSFHTTLTLHSLSEAEALRMAGRVLGTEQFPHELRAALTEKAEGVPLFIEEVAKTLLDLGVLRRENGGYRMVKGIAEVGVPDTIQGIIMARLDRLGEDGKRTVQLASVIGRQFLQRLLERIAGLAGQLEGLLAELKALEIIYEQGLLPEPAYIFKHAVIQDVAYNSLLRERRKELHRAVGYAIEELYADRLADHTEELAHHFCQAEDWPQAFEYLVRSGGKAQDAYANQAALDYYARALEAARRLNPPVTAERLMEIHRRRTRVWMVLSRYPEAIADAERTLEIARAVGDRRAEGEALADLAFAHWATFSWEHVPHAKRAAEEALAIGRETDDRRVVARSLTYLAAVDDVHADLSESDRKLAESLRLAQAGGFTECIAQNLMWLGAHANWRGDFHRGISVSRQSEDTARGIHDGVMELWALAFRTLAHIGLGEYGEALAAIHDGLAKARDWNNTFIQGRLTNTLGWLHQELGDFAQAIERDRESADLGHRTKNSNVEVSALINLGFDFLNLGEPRRALSLLEETLERVETSAFGAHRWRWSIHLCAGLAETWLVLGEVEQAVIHADKGLALARSTGSAKYVGRCHALRGDAALRARAWSQAEADLVEALRIAQEIQYPTLTWQAAHLLARAHAGGDKMEEALGAARLAIDTIECVAARAPDQALRRTFLDWRRVQAAREDLERLRRA
jgi:class 3 adenylate cyclase/tetratricopeptide (TPR) repeat protein